MALGQPAWAGSPPAAPSPLTGGETKDRLDPDALRALVKAPAANVAAGDVAGGERKFAELVSRLRARHGADALVVADTTSAFAVALYDTDHRAQSLTYFRRAAEAYRAAVGPDHPEVAVALHDIANVQLDIAPDAAPPDLIAEVEEALRIRRNALGLNNAETAVTYVLLGRLKGIAAKDDPPRVEEAAALIRFGIDCLPRTPNADPGDEASAYFRLAEVFARNNRGEEALRAAGVYWDLMSSLDSKRAIERLGDLAETLAKRDRPAAETLRQRYLPHTPGEADQAAPAPLA